MSVRVLWAAALLVGCVGGLECWDCPHDLTSCDDTEELVKKTCSKPCRIYRIRAGTAFRGCDTTTTCGTRPLCDSVSTKKTCCCTTDLCNCDKQDIGNKVCTNPAPPATTTGTTTKPASTTAPPTVLRCWSGGGTTTHEQKCAAGVQWCYNEWDVSGAGSLFMSGCDRDNKCQKATEDKCFSSLTTKFRTCCCKGKDCNKDGCKCAPEKETTTKGTTTGETTEGTTTGGSRLDTKTTATALAHLFALAVLKFN